MAFLKAGFLETYLLCYDAVWWLGERWSKTQKAGAIGRE